RRRHRRPRHQNPKLITCPRRKKVRFLRSPHPHHARKPHLSQRCRGHRNHLPRRHPRLQHPLPSHRQRKHHLHHRLPRRRRPQRHHQQRPRRRHRRRQHHPPLPPQLRRHHHTRRQRRRANSLFSSGSMLPI